MRILIRNLFLCEDCQMAVDKPVCDCGSRATWPLANILEPSKLHPVLASSRAIEEILGSFERQIAAEKVSLQHQEIKP